jgi:hypothetical protein
MRKTRRILFGNLREMNGNDAAQQIVAGERGIALFSTCFIRRWLRAAARAT